MAKSIRTIGIVLVTAAFSACSTIPPTESQITRRLKTLAEEVAELQASVAETRSHIALIDMTERAARADLIGRVDEVNTAVSRLPRRISRECQPQVATSSEACDDQPQLVEMSSDKAVLGALETVWLDPPGVAMEARIDTGATSSSLHAEGIVEFERDGADWVRFEIQNGDDPVPFEAAVIRTVRVVQQADPGGSRRPVVGIRVRVGEIDETVEFTLADRSHLEHSLILGRNFLTDLAVVDVARTFVQPPFQP